ncbi:MAG: retropepsin-like aspartic protease [Planctomycetales bacterium]
MSFHFDPAHKHIRVEVEVEGIASSVVLGFALDTGSSRTTIPEGILLFLGYDPAVATRQVRVTTPSGVELRPLVTIRRISALGHERVDLPVVCRTLPSSADIEGLLGLDFFRGHELTLDFRQGEIRLA